MRVWLWILIIIAAIIVVTIIKQIPQLRRYFRMKSM